MQGGIDQVKNWGIEWGFKFSVEKSKVMGFFSNKKKDKEIKLILVWYIRYDYSIFEKVEYFCFLGLYFDTKYFKTK